MSSFIAKKLLKKYKSSDFDMSLDDQFDELIELSNGCVEESNTLTSMATQFTRKQILHQLILICKYIKEHRVPQQQQALLLEPF